MGLDGLLRKRAGRADRHPQRHRRRRVESGDRCASPRALRREAPRAARGEQGGAAGAVRPRRRARGVRARRRQPADAAEGHGPPARGVAGDRRPAARSSRSSARATRRSRARFAAAAARHPGRVGAIIGYDEALAHLVQAGADALLVPSRFEPCGLTQLCALRYGAIPIVARVGGLADTVIDANEMALAAGAGTGIQFAPVTRGNLELAIGRARRAAARPRVVAAHAAARDGDRRRLDAAREAIRRALPRARRARRRPDRCARVGPGSPEPLGVTLGARRRERRRLLGARDAPSSSACFDADGRDASASASRCPSAPATSSTASSPASATASATGCARTARTTRATGTASIRRSCSSIRTRGRSTGAFAFASGDGRRRRRCAHRATTPTARRSCPRAIVTPPAAPARRVAAARAVGRDDHLRAARARLHADASGRAGSPARHLRGPRASRRDRAPDAPRRHDRRADADRRGDRRAAPRAASASPTTGATTPSRCSCPIRGSRPAASTKLRACVAALHAAGIEVHPRRRPQSHGRRRRARADGVAARPRQRDLLPDLRRRSRPVRRRHRLRQHARARPAAGAAARAGRASLLRRSRRASTAFASISRTTLGRRDDGFDPAAPLLQAIAQDPVLRDLKLIAEPWDVGPGGYRLGAFPPGWGEWNDRYRDTVRRFWRGDAGLHRRARDAPRGLGRHLRGALAPAVALGQLRHRARRLHARRPRRVRGQAQRGERRGQPRRHRRQLLVEPRRRRRRPTIPPSARRAGATCATCSRRCCCRAARRCSRWATSSGARSTATTTPTRRTTR